jgi:superfamily II DNA/RNA helicase
MVINLDMPMVAEDYIHRIGRTGRAEPKVRRCPWSHTKKWINSATSND